MGLRIAGVDTARLPWFMYDLQNHQLITSPIVPSDIKDSKEIVLAEQPIPGLNYSPVSPGGGGNRKIEFTLQVINRNRLQGNVFLVKQMELLRNQAGGIFGPRAGQFTPNPKVIYFWGTGSVPLVYWVAKADFTHKQNWVNQSGMPQYTEVEFSLILDESHELYEVEQMWVKAAAAAGQAESGYQTNVAMLNRRPF